MNNCNSLEQDDFDLLGELEPLLPKRTLSDGDNERREIKRINNTPILLRLIKSKHMFYRCDAVVKFSTHAELFAFNDSPHYEFTHGGRLAITRPGMSFTLNPAADILEYLAGVIDARLEQIESGDSPELQKKIEAYNMARGPQTNPTETELEQMQTELMRLLEEITAPGLKALFGYTAQTVCVWKNRGRISAEAANEICKHKEIKRRGFTRESLRPDVKFWIQDHE